MNQFALVIDGVDFNPTVPPQGVSRSGGGRQVKERFAIDGTRLASQGFSAGRRVRVASPGDNWVLRSEQVAHLQALEGAEAPFAVTLGPGYEISGTFARCWLDGPAIFRPLRGHPEYSTYDFTLYLI